MQIYLSLDGINKTIENIGLVGDNLQQKVKDTLIERSKAMELRAKQILGEKALEHYIKTGKTYWTGRLQGAIKAEVTTNATTMTGTRIGVDLRSANYAEWVEIGHRVIQGYRRETIGGPKVPMGAGSWWEGYHYLESAYLEIEPTISKKITETVKETFTHFSFKGGRSRNVQTGRFAKGTSYVTVN